MCVSASLLSLATGQEPNESANPSGQELVARAAAQMTQHPSLEAKMRQRVSIQGQSLIGSGAYVQLRSGDGNRFRLELRLQVGERLTSLQHVNDGRFLWIRRDHGAAQSLGRVDLERVRQAQQQAMQPESLSAYTSLASGGLAQLLVGLEQNFAFDEPEKSVISGVVVWQVRGRWKPDVLARLLPDQSAAILAGQPPQTQLLPAQLPDQVIVVLGGDGPLPLFPYRVEYLRQEEEGKTPHSMMLMELFEVRMRPDLDPRLFSFQLGEQRLEDETDDYLRKRGLMPVE